MTKDSVLYRSGRRAYVDISVTKSALKLNVDENSDRKTYFNLPVIARNLIFYEFCRTIFIVRLL